MATVVVAMVLEVLAVVVVMVSKRYVFLRAILQLNFYFVLSC